MMSMRRVVLQVFPFLLVGSSIAFVTNLPCRTTSSSRCRSDDGANRSFSSVVPSSRPSSSSSLGVSSSSASTTGTETQEERSNTKTIRPLDQHWWPVITEHLLDPKRATPIELLGMKLVLFQSQGEWKCMKDQCAHRFVPLSEGRVLTDPTTKKSCLQCSYHGWQFGEDGSCQHIPQRNEPLEDMSTKQRQALTIDTYPVRVQAGMVFVWGDPMTAELGHSLELPILPMLEAEVSKRGESYCYMRDVPYGYEYSAENLLDLAHLPFSHHSVGGLTREKGTPLPFRMLSKAEKSDDNPFFEAILENPQDHDPLMVGNSGLSPDAYCIVGFYDACHIRYSRESLPGAKSFVQLYMCPIAPGKSRVFLFNTFLLLPPPPPDKETQISKLQRVKESVKTLFMAYMMNLIMSPLRAHMMSHQIFDGDSIFLHKQGDRMQRGQLTYRDYGAPTSSDVLVNAFRRYLAIGERLTREAGKDSIADAAVGVNGYNDYLPRSLMLDRYETHTKNCKVCSAELEKKKRKQTKLEWTSTAMTGALGASVSSLVGMVLVSTMASEIAIPAAIIRAAALTVASTTGALVGISKLKKSNSKKIQSFFFEDYVHAEKD